MFTLRQTLNRQFHEVSDAMLSYIFINFSLTAAALQIRHISINTGFQVIFLRDIHIS